MTRRGLFPMALFLGLALLSPQLFAGAPAKSVPTETGEVHLKNLRQLSFGGENAEAYFSFDGTRLIFQSTREPYKCDQIFVMDTDGSDVQRISTGKGATTCAYFLGGDERVLFASTHEGMPDCPKRPDYSQGYVWPIHASYEIYSSLPDGSDLKPLTRTDGYDAEATVSPDGKSIVFTSERDGDLELYRMDPDGGNVKRLTNSPGYDGGAFYSYDSKKIIYRGYHPTDVKELKEFKRLLSQHLVRPSIMEIFVMDADGKNIKQVTDNGAANFCPFFHPDGKRIIFASNLHDGGGHNFDLFMIGLDGEGLERITFNDSFDAFPMFSPDGKSLVFGSNRHNAKRGDTNIFIADWVEKPEGPKHPKKAPAEPGKKKG